MKLLFFFLVLTWASLSSGMKLQYIAETSIKTGTTFAKTQIGGLSGIAYHEGLLYALSDDKGQINNERFYTFKISVTPKSVVLEPLSVQEINNLPFSDGRKAKLDPEGIVRTPQGHFLISSEGSNDSKPREMSRIFEVDEKGKWLFDLPVADKFFPEKIGKQTKGVQSNSSFEGLTANSEGTLIFAAIERALLQDIVPGQEAKGDLVRVVKYSKGESYKVAAEYVYRTDALMTSESPSEIMRGVSEILAVSDTQLLVMERGAKIDPKNLWTSTVSIYLADFSKATDVSALDTLQGAKFETASKTKLINFETDLQDKRNGKVVDNFEALAWGPRLPDGRKTLLVMSDNNFSRKQTTELIVFAVEGE